MSTMIQQTRITRTPHTLELATNATSSSSSTVTVTVIARPTVAVCLWQTKTMQTKTIHAHTTELT
jgi:hypothetical protein